MIGLDFGLFLSKLNNKSGDSCNNYIDFIKWNFFDVRNGVSFIS